ncbi:MAG: hypothetical protein AAF658_18130, partial [Myxococcota bacterium]
MTRAPYGALLTAAIGIISISPSSSPAQSPPVPKVLATFSGCPLTYDPLVARFVELEIGIPLVSEDPEPDYRVRVACEGDSVTLALEDPASTPQTFDLVGQPDADRPRIIGLKLALLLERTTADWTPPVEEPEPSPPMPELPPLLPDLPPDTELQATVTPPSVWRVYGQLGASVVGHSQVWGPRAVVGGAWLVPESPLRLSADLDVRSGSLDSTLGDVRSIQILPGAFAQYVWTLRERFTVTAGPGYRIGWAQLEGDAGAANS